MDKTILKVLGLHRAEFEKAKLNEFRAWGCQAITAFAALVSVFTTIEAVTYIGTIVALIAAVFEKIFSRQSRSQKSVAERARRLLLLVEGLGYRPSEKEIADIMVSFSASETEGKKWEDENYYWSTAEYGLGRLNDLLQESSFFSKYLFKKSAQLSGMLFGVVFLVSLLALLILPILPSSSWSILIAKVVSIILMFLISVDLIGRALDYAEAASSAQRIDDRLESLQASGINEQDLILILGDYNALVERASLVPTFIYNRNVKQLNSLWRRRIHSGED